MHWGASSEVPLRRGTAPESFLHLSWHRPHGRFNIYLNELIQVCFINVALLVKAGRQLLPVYRESKVIY